MREVTPSYQGVVLRNVDDFSSLYECFKNGFMKSVPASGGINGSFIKSGDVFIVPAHVRWRDGLGWDSGRKSSKGCCAQIVRYRQLKGNLVKRTMAIDHWRIVSYGTDGGKQTELTSVAELPASLNVSEAPVSQSQSSPVQEPELDDEWVISGNCSPEANLLPTQSFPDDCATQESLQLFTGLQSILPQLSMPSIDACMASTTRTAHEVQSIFGNVHSLIQSFIVDLGGKDHVLDAAGVRMGESFSFAHCVTSYSGSPSIESFGYHIQHLIPSFGDSPAIKNAVWTLARLSPCSPKLTWADSTLRWLREAHDPFLGFDEHWDPEDNGEGQYSIQYIISGSSDYFLSAHHVIEATFDAIDPTRLTSTVIFNHVHILKTAMEDMCEDWLICLLGVLAKLTSLEERSSLIQNYETFMIGLADLERDVATASGYVICPLTGLSYQVLAETATDFITNVSRSLTNSISCGDIGYNRIPTDAERNDIRSFGRCMSEWSLGYYLMSEDAQRTFKRLYYPQVTAARTHLARCTWPALIPNYLPPELSHSASSRRHELSDCHLRGIIPPPFDLSFHERRPWVLPDDDSWELVGASCK